MTGVQPGGSLAGNDSSDASSTGSNLESCPFLGSCRIPSIAPSRSEVPQLLLKSSRSFPCDLAELPRWYHKASWERIFTPTRQGKEKRAELLPKTHQGSAS